MVEIPGHQSTGRRGGEPSADANCPSPRSPHALDDATLDELRCEWRRLYRSEPPKLSRDLLIARNWLPPPGNPTRRTRQVDATQAEDSRQDVPDHRPSCARSRSQPKAGRPAGPRMARTHPHCHGDGRRVRVWRHDVSVADQNRQKDHRCPLVGPSLLRACAVNRTAQARRRRQWLSRERRRDRLPERMRCAIYTRKSSEEGLEQAFNSLDAQREACAAFILSQKHEGWVVLPTLYDDGGFSGGTMDRPALQRLLAIFAPARSTWWWSTKSTG